METVVLLLLFVLIVGGVFWIIRKNESVSCHSCEDHSHLAPYKIEAPEIKQPTQEEKPTNLQTPQVNFEAIRPGFGTVSNNTQTKPAKQKPAKIQPAKKESVQAKVPKAAPAPKVVPKAAPAPKAATKQTKTAPVPAKQPTRAPRAKKSNN